MRITSIQLIQGVLLRGMNKTNQLAVGRDGVDALDVVLDGGRRDVLVRREGEEDVIIWQENIACGTVDSSDDAEAETSSRGDGEDDGAGSRSPAPSSAEAVGVPAGDSRPRKGAKRARKGGAS